MDADDAEKDKVGLLMATGRTTEAPVEGAA
jgi:hypothetical protein